MVSISSRNRNLDLSWRTATQLADWSQASAELELSTLSGTQTATVDGSASVLVDWPFAPLAPRDDVSLRVRVTGADGSRSDWSEPRRDPRRVPGRG